MLNNRAAHKILKATFLGAKTLALCANPLFHLRFSKESYLNSNSRPYGWWRLFPKLHYCIFNAGNKVAVPLKGRIRKAKPKDGRRTVLFVSHELTRTGAPILLLNLMDAFSKKYNIALVSMEGGELMEKFAELASWIEVPGEMCGNKKEFMKRRIRKIAASRDVKFAIVNTIECADALIPLRKNGIPSIHLIHEFTMGRTNIWGLRLSALYANVSVFSACLVRENAVAKVPHIENPKTHVLPQGIFNPSRETISSKGHPREGNSKVPLLKQPGEILVMGAGTVDYRKGVDLFLDCAKKTIARMPRGKIRFAWVGGSFRKDIKPYVLFLRDQLEKYGLGDSFLEVDAVSNFKDACAQADIFFLSSRLDPLPIVAQTALECGIPVLCFDKAAGTAEFLLRDRDAAFGVVPYLDTTAASDRIIELARDPGLREKLGEASRRVASTCFDGDSYVKKLEELAELAERELAVQSEDAVTITNSGLFNHPFASRKNGSGYIGIIPNYVCSWRRVGLGLRKPMPGFHPGIYREDAMPERGSEDPFAAYIRNGMPKGRWVQDVLSPSGEAPSLTGSVRGSVRSALHLHFYYTKSAESIMKRVARSVHRPDLLISVPSSDAAKEIESILKAHGEWNHLIKVVPNRGRDVAPFLTGFSQELKSYEIVGHVHAKETVYHSDREEIERWNTFLLENMIGGRHPMIDFVISSFLRDKKLGLLFPDDPQVINWTDNRHYAEELALRMGFSKPLPENINFPVGTMFWARTEALAPLFNLGLDWNDYPQEPVPADGSMLHAIERLIPLVAEKSGYGTAVTHIPGIYR